MKLDKIKFAILVAFIVEESRNGFDDAAIAKIDDMIDINLPVPAEHPSFNVNDLHTLMALMHEGTRKIEAIKQLRMMTGYGLKDSKDIVEKYWISQNQPNSHERALTKINSMLSDYPNFGPNDILKQFDDEELRTIRRFLDSFT